MPGLSCFWGLSVGGLDGRALATEGYFGVIFVGLALRIVFGSASYCFSGFSFLLTAFLWLLPLFLLVLLFLNFLASHCFSVVAPAFLAVFFQLFCARLAFPLLFAFFVNGIYIYSYIYIYTFLFLLGLFFQAFLLYFPSYFFFFLWRIDSLS